MTHRVIERFVKFMVIAGLAFICCAMSRVARAQCGDPPDAWSTWSQYVAVCSKYGGHISNQRCVGWDTNWCHSGSSAGSNSSAPAGPSPEELERQRLADEQRKLAEEQRLEAEKKKQQEDDWKRGVEDAARSLKGVSPDDMTLKGVSPDDTTLKGENSDPFALKTEGTYRPSGNALIGGTTWITGFNVQSADPALVAEEHAMMATQMRLAGNQYSEGVDFRRYNFVLGIAASTTPFLDLVSRVVFDEFSNGKFSASEQAAYDSLKGRQFNELACHSNGAMVCLAALENKDIVADHVTLYGPQVTLESLKLWDELVRSGRVKSAQIYINRSDPVPPVSMLVGGGFVNSAALSSLATFKPPTLVSIINETSPHLTVQTFDCGTGSPTLDCHAMAAYKVRVERQPKSTGQTVPGTRVHGVGVAEPPPPY